MLLPSNPDQTFLMTKKVRTCYRTVPITMRKTFSGYLMFYLPKEVFKAKTFFMSHLFWKALYNYILQNMWILCLYCQLWTDLNIVPRGGSRTAATSKMEHFVIIVNGWNPLSIITKHSIVDVAAARDPLLVTLFPLLALNK